MTESVCLEDVPCPLGCPSNDQIVFTGRDILHGLPGEYPIVKCGTCGLMRTNPRPTPETMGFYYPDDYGPYLGTIIDRTEAQEVNGLRKIFVSLKNRIFVTNAQCVPSIKPGKLLEVGCASGAYLHLMAKQGWIVEGIEFSEKAAKAARELGYHVHTGSLESAPAQNEPFDLIVGWMVLEHLHDPIKGLQKLRNWAKPGAYLVLSVPNSGSLEFRLFKEKLYALHLPNHLYHFTPETLSRVLEDAGWNLEKVYHQRSLSNLIGSIGYTLKSWGFERVGQQFVAFPEKGGRWPYVLYPLAWLFSIFGQTGRMTIWAKVR